MRNIVNSYVEKFRQERRKKYRTYGLLLALALVVTAGVAWQLHSTGVAMTNVTSCGLEEHQHDESCYEQVLVCGLETSEGHAHTEDCYELQLVCGLEEHTHTAECVSNQNVDVETADKWEETLPELSGVWAQDVVAIAESQLGYTESTSNFTLGDDGETHQGYTRYGAWYGNEYGDWGAMFVSFCLHYAGLDESVFPEASGAYAWTVKLDELGLYADAAEYAPVPGDLVFFDTDGDAKADRVGIAVSVSEDVITVVEGDYAAGDADAVCMNEYSLSDSYIMGYGVLPEQEGVEAAEPMNGDASSDTADGEAESSDGKGLAEGSGTTEGETGEEQTVLNCEGDDYTVTVSYGADAGLPDDVELIVSEYEKDSEIWELCYASASALYEEESITKESFRLFDISLYADGEEVEPAAEVSVMISYPEAESGTYTIVHFEEEEPEGTANVLEAESEYESGVQTITFSTDGFSLFGAGLLGTGANSGSSLVVSALVMSSVVDGTAPWDYDDTAGNDSGDENLVVRTFDSVVYNLTVSVNDTTAGATYESAGLWLEITLDKDMTEALFDTDTLKYLDFYTITYYDEDDNVLGTGYNGLPDYSANDYANGSDKGTDSYKTPVVKQVLLGYVTETNIDGSSFASLQKTLEAGIDVKVACNGDTLQPTFRVWTEFEDEKSGGKEVTPDEVTISAAPNYNVALTRSTTLAYESSFDLVAGLEATDETSDENKVTGVMLGYAITLQLYNADEDKGLKGIEFPQGEISLDISFKESDTTTSQELDFNNNFTPILWDYDENVGTVSTEKNGEWGRTLYWNNLSYSAYASYNAPLNAGDDEWCCYSGGDWSIEGNKVTDASTLSGTESETYTFKISGYDFDLDSYLFPNRTETNSDTIYTDNIGCFSAGYVEVLLQYDDEQVSTISNTTNIYMNAAVENFAVESLSGKTVDTEMTLEDNENQAAITLKSPGYIEKYNAINSKKVDWLTKNYLGVTGTDSYWTSSECGDPAAYAGSTVALAGGFGLSTSASVTITDFNYLQIFDSTGFSLISDLDSTNAWKYRDGMEDLGTVTFLYAADPDYPGGYDSNSSVSYTNAEGKLVASADYMYNVEETDLIYFGSLADLNDAGYTCIGVLMEARGATMNAGGYAGLSFEVVVSDDEALVGKTICTINRVKCWTDNKAAGVTFKGATTEELVAEVIIDSVYSNPRYNLNAHEAVNSNSKNYSQYLYCKTEYEDGSIVTGTHLNGKWAGMSLLILGYETSLDLDTVDSKEFYNLDNNERTANYVISDIQTTIDSANSNITSSGQYMTTDLKITITLDEGLAIDFDTLYMGGEKLSASVDSPTSLTYIGTVNGKEKTTTYTVYYEYDADTQTVTVHVYDAPVGVQLPDITFSAAIGEIGSVNDVGHRDTLTVTAQITGSSDNRAYSEAAGNQSSKTITVSKLESTTLIKSVDKTYAELGDSFTYTLQYTNNGSAALTGLYMYDLLPYNGDSRSSDFSGTVKMTGVTAGVTLSGTEVSSYSANVELYYSLLDGNLLENIIEFRNLPDGDTNGVYLQQLLQNALVDSAGNVYYFQDDNGNNINLTSWNEDASGYISIVNDEYSSFVQVSSSSVTYDTTTSTLTVTGKPVTFSTETYMKLFKSAGTLTSALPSCTVSGEMQQATCLVAITSNLGSAETICLDISVQTEGNSAGDHYVNSAHSWTQGSSGSTELDSNTVKTRIVSHSISGQVWHDEDKDGVYDTGEKLLENVTCTLFVWDSTVNQYVKCTQDVTGSLISSVTTGSDGAYSFSNLAAGDYIVAFQSADGTDVLLGYYITKYQVENSHATEDSDGAAISSRLTELDGYVYYIQYSLSSDSMELHALDEIGSHLNSDYIELYAHEDLGLITYILPLTGGTGTYPYAMAGMLLTGGAAYLLYRSRRRKEKFI